MYLGMMKESNKKLFLELAYKLACVDEDYSKAEQEMMKAYCTEMQVSMDICDTNCDVEEILKQMKEECNGLEKKIIVFETIGLAMADSVYDKREKAFIDKVLKLFEVEKEYGEDCEEVLGEYFALQNRINQLVLDN